jgi:MFS family permease
VPFSRRFGTKRVYLAGLTGGPVSMLLLVVSAFFESNTSVAFPLLLLATAFLGLGFGLTVPALNTLTAAFHATGVESSAALPLARWLQVTVTQLEPHPNDPAHDR